MRQSTIVEILCVLQTALSVQTKLASTIVEILCVLQTQQLLAKKQSLSTIVEILCVLQTYWFSCLIPYIYDSRNSLCLIDYDTRRLWTDDLRQQKFFVSYRPRTSEKNKILIISTIVEILCVLQTKSLAASAGLYLRQQKFFVSYRRIEGGAGLGGSTIVEILCVLQTQMKMKDLFGIYDSRNSLCLIDKRDMKNLDKIYLRQQKFFVSYRRCHHRIQEYHLRQQKFFVSYRRTRPHAAPTEDLRQQKFFVSYRHISGTLGITVIYDSRNSLCLIDQSIRIYDADNIYDSRNSLCLIDY